MSYNLLSPAFSLPSKEFEDIKLKNQMMNESFINMNGNNKNKPNLGDYQGSNISLNKPNYQYNQQSYYNHKKNRNNTNNNNDNNKNNDDDDDDNSNVYSQSTSISPNTIKSPINSKNSQLFYQSTPKKQDNYLSDLEYQPLNHFKSHSIHQNLSSLSANPKVYKSIDPKSYTKTDILKDDTVDDSIDKYLDSSLSNSSSSFINQDDLNVNSRVDPDDTSANSKSTTVKSMRKKLKKELPFDLNSHDKPPYSYATLIGISILSNPEKKLTLSQIYYWISSTFKYYKREDVGWQNSIRHNLSLNKAFIKGEKSKDGKGHYWKINDGFEDLFLKKNVNNLLKTTDKHKIPSSPIECIELPSKVREETTNEIPDDNDNELDNNEDHEEHDDDDDDDELDEIDEIEDHDTDITRIIEPPTKIQKLGDPFWELPKSLPEVNIIDTESSPPQLARKNLTYSSSFSCNSNLEFSPIRSSETGPLLEPLTPGKNILSIIQPNNLLKPSLLQPYASQSNNISNNYHASLSNNNSSNNLQKTPKTIKTPLKNLRTPQSSIIRKLWNSPSYLEEFYSPLITHAHHINSYDDDDMILRNLYPSPNVLKKLNNNLPLKNLSKNLYELSNCDNSKLQDNVKKFDNIENSKDMVDAKAQNKDED